MPILVAGMFIINLILGLIPPPQTEASYTAQRHICALVLLLGLLGIMAITVWAGAITLTLFKHVRVGNTGKAKRS